MAVQVSEHFLLHGYFGPSHNIGWPAPPENKQMRIDLNHEDPTIRDSDMKDLEMIRQFLVESGRLEKHTDIGTPVANLSK